VTEAASSAQEKNEGRSSAQEADARAGDRTALRAPEAIGESAVQAKPSDGAAQSEAMLVHEAAARGTGGTGGQLPYLDKIQRSFGRHDVSHVQAHTGQVATEASLAMGAEAFATGEHVAFAGAPTLHTAAHEAAHVIQQRTGVQLKGGVGEAGDRYEQHADAVADRVVRGESAEAMLDEVAGAGGPPSGHQHDTDRSIGTPPAPAANLEGHQPAPVDGSAVVQRYVPFNANQAGVATGGAFTKAVRVSSDGTVAVAQDNIYGSQDLYVDDCGALIASANETLQQRKSPLVLSISGHHKLSDPEARTGADPIEMSKVTFENSRRTKPKEKTSLPADCGQAAHEICGAENLIAIYTHDGNPERTETDNPLLMKFEVMLRVYEKSIRGGSGRLEEAKRMIDQMGGMRALASEFAASRTHRGSSAKKARVAEGKARELEEKLEALEEEFMRYYRRLSPEKQDELDKTLGINRWANPEIGEAYTTSSGGEEHAGMPEGASTWNYHYAAVVLKSSDGSDAVALENYATRDPDEINQDWSWQMYGAPGKDTAPEDTQSFHEQHRDAHGQHGQTPTTLRVIPPDSES
jgi:hypothetical protein